MEIMRFDLTCMKCFQEVEEVVVVKLSELLAKAIRDSNSARNGVAIIQEWSRLSSLTTTGSVNVCRPCLAEIYLTEG